MPSLFNGRLLIWKGFLTSVCLSTASSLRSLQVYGNPVAAGATTMKFVTVVTADLKRKAKGLSIA